MTNGGGGGSVANGTDYKSASILISLLCKLGSSCGLSMYNPMGTVGKKSKPMMSVANLVEPRHSIYVDSLTAVPVKLYMEIENAGASARRRGQHTLRESRATDGTLRRSLVKNGASGESRREPEISSLDILRAEIAALQNLLQQKRTCSAPSMLLSQWAVSAGRSLPFRSDSIR